MVTLSLAMIVKNEEKTMERVLSCAKSICDEMVIVDTGSTDSTVEIAERMGAKVFNFKWINHFAAARNYSFEQCTSDWIMWLDADDVISEADQQKLLQLKQTELNDEIDGVYITYQYAFDSEDNCIHTNYRERLIRRAAGLKWEYPVHECIALPYGRTLKRTDICIAHRQLPELMERKVDRNLKILEKAIADGDCSPRNLFYFSNELRDHKRHEEAITYYLQYLEVSNLAWEKYSAMLHIITCLKALERHDEVLSWCLKALAFNSERAEAFIQAGVFYYHKEQWLKAIPYFTAASVLPRPQEGFINEPDYSWVPWDYMSICYERLRQYDKAIEMSLKALKNNPDKKRIISNLHWMIDQL